MERRIQSLTFGSFMIGAIRFPRFPGRVWRQMLDNLSSHVLVHGQPSSWLQEPATLVMHVI